MRKFDDAGVHPEFAAQICEVGRFFADKSKLTAPLVRSFENVRNEFLGRLESDRDMRSAQATATIGKLRQARISRLSPATVMQSRAGKRCWRSFAIQSARQNP